MTKPLHLRPRPCASCPYRLDAPSGLWDESEYTKLEDYDQPTGEQPPNIFACHQQDNSVCAGWLACHDPQELLAVRIGVLTGSLPIEVMDWTTEVPVHASGAEAKAHGMAEYDAPGARARRHAAKLGKGTTEAQR